ncbi:MAG: hypothetical protein RR891_02600 [Clostridium sp.]
MRDCKYSLQLMQEELKSKYICPEIKYAFKASIEALEKQIPKKPKIMNTTLIGEKFWWYCGHCGASRHTGNRSNYCGYCGGKVDWD